MNNGDEKQRLKEVYNFYKTSKKVQTKWSEANPGNYHILNERRRVLYGMLQSKNILPLSNRIILDMGCGSGKVLASLLTWGAKPANLYGVDILSDRIAEAKQNFPEIFFQTMNGENLEYQKNFFDLIIIFTVFSSIFDMRMRSNVAKEVSRILKPRGAIIWYDFRYNNPRNPHVRGMNKNMIQDLFPDYDLNLRPITLLPPLARKLGPLTSIIYPLLAAIPGLRTHYLGLLTPSNKLVQR